MPETPAPTTATRIGLHSTSLTEASFRGAGAQGDSQRGMELAGLEPATSWVRSRAAFGGDNARFWL
jgi:hypothetical protein